MTPFASPAAQCGAAPSRTAVKSGIIHLNVSFVGYSFIKNSVKLFFSFSRFLIIPFLNAVPSRRSAFKLSIVVRQWFASFSCPSFGSSLFVLVLLLVFFQFILIYRFVFLHNSIKIAIQIFVINPDSILIINFFDEEVELMSGNSIFDKFLYQFIWFLLFHMFYPPRLYTIDTIK